ncbi:ribosome assembly RNA-binding protein YhbY [Fructobacillus tropaeoli]|uniref:ribosome assembly RNA-binding protein YhbY n=1 Tax=Fructobacillus tropaeoli TaxID=709323 RepID=UPI002D9569D0|nr:RNA-binding protein YhbY (YhbY) [Fructobacillus tropaeoli]
MQNLTGKQKRYLRSQANGLTPIFSVGKAGANQEWLAEVKKALAKRELIKVNLQQGSDWSAKDLAAFIEEESTVKVAQVIGKTLVLYEPATDAKYVKYSVEVEKIR